MKVFPHGIGGGEGPTNYLVRMDYHGREEKPPHVLRGDVDMTRDLINALGNKWKFTAGVLSWHPDDKVTPEQEEKVMDDFEKLAFAGLDPDKRNILWVRHSHAGHHELHFVIPRVELSTGKAFNPCPPGWQRQFDVFRDLHNLREGWARPDDPNRARLFKPEHADLHNARLIRWGKAPTKDARAEAKQAIHAYLQTMIEQGLVHNREDVLSALKDAGLGINRAGKDYITVVDPESNEKLRLKGGMYGEQFQFSGRTHESADRAGTRTDRSPVSTNIAELERQFANLVLKRAEYHQGRYGKRNCERDTEIDLTMPKPRQRAQSPVCQMPDMELPACPDDSRDLGQPDMAVQLPNQELAAGSGRIASAPGQSESELCPDMDGVQGAGALREPGDKIPSDRQGLVNRLRRDSGQQERLENRTEEISHDRSGTPVENRLAGTGERSGPEAGQSGGTVVPAGRVYSENAAGHQPATERAGTINRAITALEQCVREFTAAVEAIERLVARQIEKIRAQEQQPHRRMGMGR